MHSWIVYLVICGKYLVNGGKLVKIDGVNIVNLT